MSVRFTKVWRMYQRGEIAGFEASVEDLLVSGGFAVRVGPDAAPDDALVEANDGAGGSNASDGADGDAGEADASDGADGTDGDTSGGTDGDAEAAESVPAPAKGKGKA